MPNVSTSGTGPQPAGLPQGTITTVAGAQQGAPLPDGRPNPQTLLGYPQRLTVDRSGNLYFADWIGNLVRKVTPQGVVTTVAGTGQEGYTPDGGPAAAAMLRRPSGVAVDANGNLYIAESYNHLVRKVDAKGVLTTVAGNGQRTNGWNGGPVTAVATATPVEVPTDVAVDADGSLYIAEHGGHRIRKVDTKGMITILAGGGAGAVADGRPASVLNAPYAVAVDHNGNVYFVEYGIHRVRKIDPSGVITTVAGNGVAGYGGDGGPAALARLYSPSGVALDAAGNLYIGDRDNRRVRGVSSVATMAPPPLPSADLYGEVVSVPSVHRGQEFDLGARIKNRGPKTADGKDVTVVLTLAEALRGPAGTTGRQLSRTFTGQRLKPHHGSLDGVFRVHAPDGTPPGLYTSTLEIRYGGDPNLTDNTYTLPVTVVVAAPAADETALTITQASLLEAEPGQRTAVTVRIDSASGQPINPGDVFHRFTAPTGFVFTGQPFYGYYNTIHGVIAGNLDYRIEDDGRTLIVMANPHVNTTTSDTGPLYYTIPLQARPDAVPGTYDGGSVNIGRHPRVPLIGTVTGTAQSEAALRVRQKNVPRAAPGESTVFNVEIGSPRDEPTDPGTIEHRFIAPTGFAFTSSVSYGYSATQPAVTGSLDSRLEDDGTALVFSFDPHVNTGLTDRSALIYTIGIRALPGADRGTHDDGAIAIGSLLPIPLTATVD
ncbi:hypothetical protein ABT354_30600 [Streptomyces sp. NPDC000594]|uniref:NHL domain-containing protein n=1 Tax=Streptomyces sp. NPDC000594 TaxID=3154261 RepID=UPI00332A0374